MVTGDREYTLLTLLTMVKRETINDDDAATVPTALLPSLECPNLFA